MTAKISEPFVYDLPEMLASIYLTVDNNIGDADLFFTTIDDFYDFVGIPMQDRTDFGTVCLLQQAFTLLDNSKQNKLLDLPFCEDYQDE